MKKFKWILLLLITTSCRSQETDSLIIVPDIPKPEIDKKCNCLQFISIDTTTSIIREQKEEIHLLRLEIDDLKKRLENIRKLQELDSIIKINEE